MNEQTYTDATDWLIDRTPSQPEYKRIVRSSFYLTMRDGVKIALDLYLPKDPAGDTKLPAIFHQTRYYRRYNYRWMVKSYMRRRESFWAQIQSFVRNGYAVINIDVRGTGASFGTRQIEWSPEEVKDGAEVVDWIVQQPWSSGAVGSIGTSYTGSSAEFCLTNQHKNIKAAVIRYANFDTYADVLNPGGIRNDNFLRIWSELNYSLDTGRLPEYLRNVLGWIGRLLIHNVAPVDGDTNGEMLAEAQREHKANYDIYTTAKRVQFRDDVTEQGVSIDQLSPASYIDKIEGSATPVYSWSSWFDGGFTSSAIKRYLNVDVPGKRLTLGPWDHGGKQFPDTNSPNNQSRFDHTGEVLRFFDRYLKEVDNGIDQEAPVRYYTMGEGSWKTSQAWPPPGFTLTPLYFSHQGKLVWDNPPSENGTQQYQVDYSATSGIPSRWLSLVNVTDVKIGYPDRVGQDLNLIVFQSAALERHIEVTGSPVLTLYIKSNSEDGAFFAYLEDVTPGGQVHYVTEGMLRAIHRQVSNHSHPHLPGVPYHTFMRRDSQPLIPGEVALLTFDLLPVSYLFRRGHQIRLAIAGADRDNFELVPDVAPIVEILWGNEYPSVIELPIKII